MGLLNIGTSMCLKTSKQECGCGPKAGHRGIWPRPSGISNFLFIFPIPQKAFFADVGLILFTQFKQTTLHSRPVLGGSWPFVCYAYNRWLVEKRQSVCAGTGVCGSCGHIGHKPQLPPLQKLILDIMMKLNYWHVGA